MPYTNVESRPLPTLYADFDSLLADSFHSTAELQVMPQGERQKNFRAADIVRGALEGCSDESVPIEVGWQMAASFLDGLAEAQTNKDVYNGNYTRDEVVERLESSLRSNPVTERNASTYLAALTSIVNSKSFVAPIGECLVKSHAVMREVTDEAVQKGYKSFLADPEVIVTLGDMYQDSFGHYDDELRYDGAILYGDVLAGLGFNNVEECVGSWGIKPREHIRVISELERERSGAAALLHNFYGIRHFGRHTVAMLTRQFDEHGDTSKPYGVELYALEDQGNALMNQWRTVGAYKAVEDEYGVRIIEAETVKELHMRMSSLDRMYGDKHKISFATVNAHGGRELVVLSSMHDRTLGSLTVRHNFGTARQWFVENPTILLASCSLGQENGIAQRLSARLRATVVGAEENTGVEDLKVVKDANRLKLEPQFAVDDSGEVTGRRMVAAALYIDGEKIAPIDQRYSSYFAELSGSTVSS